MYNKELRIGVLSGFDTSPSGEWHVYPHNPEGYVESFFYMSPDCQIREIKFPPEIYKDGILKAYFQDESTFVLLDLEQESPKGSRRKINIFIFKNGEYAINALTHR